MPKRKKPPSQTWRVFLDNHLLELVSIDFLVVPTATFRILLVLIVLGEAHLRRTLTRYFRYYHNFRTHLSLEKDAPAPRAIQDANFGAVIEVSEVGGPHHHYERRAA